MKKYRIFTHEQKQEAVKIGFSWPAFFFTLPWLLYKRMWAVAAGVLFLVVLISAAMEAGVNLSMGDPNAAFMLELFGHATEVSILVLFAMMGNDWYAKKLLKRGFRHVTTIAAPNPNRAKSIFDEEYVYDDQAGDWVKFDGILGGEDRPE